MDYSKGEKTLYRTDTGEAVKVETISAIERQRYIEFVEKENKDGEISQAVKKAEEKKAGKKGKSKDVKKKDTSCPDCGAPEGEEHSEGCPTLMPEPEQSEPEEASEVAADDMPEEDCFGTFDSNDAECANCDRLQECSKETLSGGETEKPAEEPAVKESAETPFYTCKKCGKGFEEYIDKGDGVWECPHCKADDWI